MSVDKNCWAYYQTKTLGVFPYMAGVPVFRDGMLPFLYTKLKAEGKTGDLFCGDEKNMDDFVSFFNRIKTLQVLCRIKEDKDLVPVGIGWADLPRGKDGARACQCGEAFFDGASKTSDARDLARLALAYVFNALKIDVIHGIQLESNYAARNFSVRLGFKECAIVPKWHYINGELEAARIMILKKEDFIPSFEKWFEPRKLVVSEAEPGRNDPGTPLLSQAVKNYMEKTS